MDWFDSGNDAAAIQIQALNHALKLGGRVMLRSAGLRPWYVAVFDRLGFSTQRVAARLPGTCIDRSVWSTPYFHRLFPPSVASDIWFCLCSIWLNLGSICMLRRGSWRKRRSSFDYNRTKNRRRELGTDLEPTGLKLWVQIIQFSKGAANRYLSNDNRW